MLSLSQSFTFITSIHIFLHSPSIFFCFSLRLQCHLKIYIFVYCHWSSIKLYTLKRYSQNTRPTGRHLRISHLSLPPLCKWKHFHSKKIYKLIWSQQPSHDNCPNSTTSEIFREPKETI